MKDLSEKITGLAENVLPKSEGNSCYLDMDEGIHAYSSAVWLFPDGIFRSSPYTHSYVRGEKIPYKEHTMVYKEIFEPIKDEFKHRWEDGDEPIYPETADEINSAFRDHTNSIRVRCRQSKDDNRKELLIKLNLNNIPTEAQFRSIRRELCDFDYDLFYYDITDEMDKNDFWMRTFGGAVTPTCANAFRNMKKDFEWVLKKRSA